LHLPLNLYGIGLRFEAIFLRRATMMTKKTTHKIPAPTRTDVGLTSMAIVLRVVRFMSALSPLVTGDDDLVFAGSTVEMVDALKAAQTYTETVSEPRGKCLDGFLQPTTARRAG
jgi:hypothetical protein